MIFLHLLTISAILGSLEAKACTSLPPGLLRLVKGADLARLDLLPLEPKSDSGLVSQVLALTCDDENQWKSAKGKVYDLPDQVWQITSVPGGYMSSEVTTLTTTTQVRDSLSASVGVEGESGQFAFSTSVSFNLMQSSITNSSSVLSVVTAFSGAVRIDVNPPQNLQLDAAPQKYIDTNLTGSFESNPDAYYKFIKTYGTHYFSRGNFGGYIKMVCETKSDYFATTSETSIETNAQASYNEMIAQAGTSTPLSSKVDSTYKNNTKTSIKFYGGDTALIAKEGLGKWQPSVEDNPWLYSGKLKPISDLIKNATKKAEMIKAVEFYMLKNQLDSLEAQMIGTKAKSDNSMINQLLGDVQLQKKKQFPSSLTVRALTLNFAEYCTIPVWFQKAKLCMTWKGTKDAAQCGGPGVPAQICAQVNNMTQWYLDNTDSRQGGCNMSWGLLASGFAGFFDNIRICYQFSAENDPAQCGNAIGGQFCSPATNSFTTPYFDDTAGRKGGCKLQWMLKAPTSVAPIWMQAVQLCFKWEADGDAAQCGGGAANSQCVSVNQWTKFYTDTTDDRKGGCKMSWGLKSGF
ncbi:perivitellin-2 67 kDa subunit-like [Physella acuta]|uniref:perivitellin-2 67 kDa subunit-like n=1 Tax=Physella acuta TaxID=109671 RepID=UPI0027DD8FA7|nr:perivitellin-2 67 kDa subunit-like [Physella acuta]